MPDRTLDTKGLACPLPILKTKTALSELPKGATLEVLATDPGSVPDFTAFCETTGNKLVEKSDIKCPNCGREMIKRRGRFGFFLGCSGYSIKDEKGEPSCSTIINLDKEGNPLPPKVKIQTTVACEKCSSPMIGRWGRFGKFLSCSTYPECKNARPLGGEHDELETVRHLQDAIFDGYACHIFKSLQELG